MRTILVTLCIIAGISSSLAQIPCHGEGEECNFFSQNCCRTGTIGKVLFCHQQHDDPSTKCHYCSLAGESCARGELCCAVPAEPGTERVMSCNPNTKRCE